MGQATSAIVIYVLNIFISSRTTAQILRNDSVWLMRFSVTDVHANTLIIITPHTWFQHISSDVYICYAIFLFLFIYLFYLFIFFFIIIISFFFGGGGYLIFCWFKSIIHSKSSGSLYTLQWRHNGHDSVSNHHPHDCFLNRLFRRRSKKTSKLRVTGLCAGNSPGTGEFPAQMASNAKKCSIWWRHHGKNPDPRAQV